jgi:hypothetical protein
VISPFTLIVIPGLTEPAPYLIRGNPVFSPLWTPAGVYPDENRGRNDGFDATIYVKKSWTHYTRGVFISKKAKGPAPCYSFGFRSEDEAL